MRDVTDMCRIGTVVSLESLGHAGTGEVVASSWSEALGDVVRIRPNEAYAVAAILVVYGEDLDRVLLAPLAA
ncbi:MAG TPA: hypothetical protein VFM09_06150 [Marmoricola sp.]|nr:hypothetical protein [Marmoricola sp.]